MRKGNSLARKKHDSPKKTSRHSCQQILTDLFEENPSATCFASWLPSAFLMDGLKAITPQAMKGLKQRLVLQVCG